MFWHVQTLQNLHLLGAWCILKGLQAQLNWTQTVGGVPAGDKPGKDGGPPTPAPAMPGGAGAASKAAGPGGKAEGTVGGKAGKEMKEAATVPRATSAKR